QRDGDSHSDGQRPGESMPRVVRVFHRKLHRAKRIVIVQEAQTVHDEQYRPVLVNNDVPRQPVGDEPLTWWAVKRVSRYAGRINVWLAGGFGILYAAYT